LIGPFAVVCVFTLVISIPLSLLDASVGVVALGLAACMVVVAIMADRAAGRWPESTTRR